MGGPGSCAVHVDESIAVRLHRGGLVRPRPLAEHHHARPEVGRDVDRVGRHGNAVRAVAERTRGRGTDRHARLREVRPVAFDLARLERVEDHARRFIEPISGLVHRDAEAFVLVARQAATHAEQHTPVREVVEQRDLLRDAERFVPRQDHRAGAEQDAFCPRRHVGEEHGVVGAERVVTEVVLDRPQGVEAELIGQLAEADLLLDHIPVGDVVSVTPRLEHHLQPDSHGRSVPSRSRAPPSRLIWASPARPNAPRSSTSTSRPSARS